MKSLLISLALLMFLSDGVCADSSDYVVSIVADINGQSKQSEGTGFFWGTSDQIVTAYHVIRNSNTIHISYKTERSDDVTVVSVSGDYDLAILRVRGIRPTYFFKEDYNVNLPYPGLDVNSNLIAPCYPRDSINPQDLHGNLTSRSFQPSFNFHDKKGRYLFRTTIDIIETQAFIYDGASGAPLLFGNTPIGVISGSLNEGGTLAWAIPISDLSSLISDPHPIAQAPQQIRVWPSLTLVDEDVARSFSIERLRPGTNNYVDVSFGKEFLDLNSTASNFPAEDLNALVAVAYTHNLYKLSAWVSAELSLIELDYPYSYQTLPGTGPLVGHAMSPLPLISGFYCYTFFQRTNFEPYIGAGLGFTTLLFSESDTAGSFTHIFPVIPQIRGGFTANNIIFFEIRALFTSFAVSEVSFSDFGQGTLFDAWDWRARFYMDIGLRL
jgi:hypothetical protein